MKISKNVVVMSLLGALVAVIPFSVNAQAPAPKELVYAVLNVEGVPAAQVSVVKEGIKFTVWDKPLVLEWEAIELLKKSFEEYSK